MEKWANNPEQRKKEHRRMQKQVRRDIAASQQDALENQSILLNQQVKAGGISARRLQASLESARSLNARLQGSTPLPPATPHSLRQSSSSSPSRRKPSSQRDNSESASATSSVAAKTPGRVQTPKENVTRGLAKGSSSRVSGGNNGNRAGNSPSRTS